MEYDFIGWCREDNHDKVWAVIQLDQQAEYWNTQKWITVWGRRGKKLQHKIIESDGHDMRNRIDKKRNKGYRQILIVELNSVYPEFQQDLEQTAVWGLLMV